MTITSNKALSEVQLANGSNRLWDWDFKIKDLSHIVLLVTDPEGEVTEVTSGFTATGLGNANGGTVTYPIAPTVPLASGSEVVVARRVPFLQTTKIGNQGAFLPEIHEEVMDLLAMQIQQLNANQTNSLQAPLSDGLLDMTLPSVAARAGKVLGFDEDGLPDMTVGQSLVSLISSATTQIGDWVDDVEADKDTVAADKAIVAADKATISGWKTTIEGWKDEVEADKNTVAADKAIVAADKALTLGYRNEAETFKNTATTQAGTATTQATNAAASAAAAALSEAAVTTMAAAMATLFDDFGDTYLGPHAAAPTVDNDGGPLTAGDLYFDTAANVLRVWKTAGGGAWLSIGAATGLLASLDAVDTAQIVDGAVTAIKLAANAVTTAKILANNVTLAKLQTIAANSILGSVAGGDVSELTPANVKTILALALADISGAQAAIDAKVADALADGVTTVAPSQNAVFDALALKGKAVDFQRFDSSGTWTKPSGIGLDSLVFVRIWGAGGGGAWNTGAGYNCGGAGGGYLERWIKAGDLGSTVSITVGAGGAGRTGSAGAGAKGGVSAFGGIYAYGGGGGTAQSGQSNASRGGTFASAGANGYGDGSAGNNSIWESSTSSWANIFPNLWAGGPGGQPGQPGGSTWYGGAGGGGAQSADSNNAGGISYAGGGNGGKAGYNGVSAQHGQQPGGGGGATWNAGQGGNGGDGRVDVYTFDGV